MTGSQPAAIGGGEFVTGGTPETERIIVTGSNIPTAQEVGANPVLNISRDLINKSGERTAEALIKNLPIANGGGVPISNNATGFTPGANGGFAARPRPAGDPAPDRWSSRCALPDR